MIGAFRADANGNPDSGRSYVVFGGNNGPGTGVIVVVPDPVAAAFGSVPISGSPLTLAVDLANVGEQGVQLGPLTLDAPASFSIAADQCSGQPLGTIVGMNDRCSFEVQLLADTPGLFEGELTVSYPSFRSPVVIPLSGFVDGVFIDGFEGE